MPTLQNKSEKENPAPKTKTKTKIKMKILIVDDHPIVRQGLRQMINQEEDLIVCAEAENTEQALDAIKNGKPDIAIIDISLKSISGIELLKQIKEQHPLLVVLVLSMHDESIYAERALKAGARGYIMKHEASGKLLHALRSILEGNVYVSDRMNSKLLHQAALGKETQSALENLSDRELEVFQLIGRGIRTRDIAEQLGLSIKTIESYREHLKRKLGLSNGAELIQHAIQWVKLEDTTA
jgi:DNA-binding NarL/FixJ family response regulator